jgi:hypothetical protein
MGGNVFRPKGYSIVRGIWHCPRDLALSEGFGTYYCHQDGLIVSIVKYTL